MTPQNLVEKYFKDLTDPPLLLQKIEWTKKYARFALISQEDIILSGQEIFERSLRFLDIDTKITWHIQSGDLALKNQVIASISGQLISILTVQDIALHFLAHLSGVATLARCYSNLSNNCTFQSHQINYSDMNELENKALQDGQVNPVRQNQQNFFYFLEAHQSMSKNFNELFIETKNNSGKPVFLEVQTPEFFQANPELQGNHCILSGWTIEQLTQLDPAHRQLEICGYYSLEDIMELLKLGFTRFSIHGLKTSAPTASLQLVME